MKNIYICLTFDTDPDIAFFSNEVDTDDKKILGWKGLSIGKDLIFNSIKKIERKHNFKIPQSWFVRVDDQIKFYHKNADWLFLKFKKFWKKIEDCSGSLEWHIHLNTKSKSQKWMLEKNEKKISRMLKKNFSIFKTHSYPNCIRIGEAFMTNEIAKVVFKLGINADSSCLPGRKREDDFKHFDWSKSKNNPYYMSKNNYQVSEKKNKKKYLLEIPMNTKLTKCSYDKKYLKRYFNLSFYNDLFSQNLDQFIKKNEFLVSMTHPFEVVKKFKNKQNSKLISFSKKEFERNLESIISNCYKNKKIPVFVNINDLIKIIEKKNDKKKN